METEPLKVAGLSAGYGRVQVVMDVSLEVRPGEMVALVGRNGAGKTTLMSAIGGLRYSPSAGSVKIGPTEVSTASPSAIAQAGLRLVPEGRRVFRNMTVEDNLRLGAFLHRRAGSSELRSRMDNVCELFPALAEFGRRLVGELSGGQQQMVAVGQALMSRPNYLLLDEPTAGLAPALIAELYDKLGALAKTGLGILIVDQSIERVITRADRYYLMETGRFERSGPAVAAEVDAINAIVLARVPDVFGSGVVESSTKMSQAEGPEQAGSAQRQKNINAPGSYRYPTVN